MELYHGTNVDFDTIDIAKCNPYKDFGQGFYLTDLYSQAEELAVKRAQINGGHPIVQTYVIDDDIFSSSELKIKIFNEPNEEWAQFIYNNRFRKIEPFKHDFDIVIGPIANDGVAYLLNRYDEATLSLKDLAKELKYKKLNRQYFFGNEVSIKHLIRQR
jgi:hypothetical protein